MCSGQPFLDFLAQPGEQAALRAAVSVRRGGRSALSAALPSDPGVSHAKIGTFFNSGSCLEGPTDHILIPKEVMTRTRMWPDGSV